MERRSLLRTIAMSPMGFLASPNFIKDFKSSARLEITDMEAFRVRVNRRGNWTIVRLRTNGGMTGLGDASHGYGDIAQSTNDDDTLRYLKEFSSLLRGRSIFDTEWLHITTSARVAQAGLPAAVAASALEQCLWDLQGKALSVPTYDLFGGRIQPRIRMYANINRATEDRTPEGFSAVAEKAIRAGFDAIKLAPFDGMPPSPSDPARVEHFTQLGIACANAVRQQIGPLNDLMIDAHSHFGLESGLALARSLEPLKLYWLEEVTPANPISALAKINESVAMPTAGGETLQGVTGFYPYIVAKAVDILMPDVKVCGGMLQMKKIAGIAEGAGLLTSPHGPASPVGNVSAAHVIASIPNFNILEFAFGEVPWRAELIDPPEEIYKSALVLSRRPGLGISLNERVAAKYRV